MAIGLDDALLGWLVESAGGGLVHWLRGDPARATMRKLVEEAVDKTVEEFIGGTHAEKAEHLRASLLVRNVAVDGDRVRVTSESELRDALHAWTEALDQLGYLSELGVAPDLVAEALTRRIVDDIRRNGRGRGPLNPLAEWLYRDELQTDVGEIRNDVATIRQDLSRLAQVVEQPSPSGHGLPGVTPLFTGRADMLAALDRRIKAHDPAGIVVAVHSIHGMAGVGKTQLALRTAHEHKQRYPDGQYFINLHGYSEGITPMPPEVALEELLRQAGVPDHEVPREQAERQARWQALMASKRALVLLDNALDGNQIRPLLPGSASCLVLVTSRTRLTGLPSATALHLDVLPRHEATELFIRIIGPSRYTDQETATRVADLVGRLPVAIEAAAGQVHDDLTVTELANDLTDATRNERIMGDLGPLGGSVRATFETSLQRLSQIQREAFLALGLFPGFTVGVAQFAALAAMPAATARSTLRGLAERNLVKPARDPAGLQRYEMHDLMRDFARQQATSLVSIDERSAALARLTRWYTTAIDAHEALWDRANEPGRSVADLSALSELGESRDWLVAEQANLRAFARAGTSEDAAHVCYRYARMLCGVDSDWTAHELLQAAYDLYHRTGNRSGEANALLELGSVTGGTLSGGDYYHRALTIFQKTGNRAGEAAALAALGDGAAMVDDQIAGDYYHRALIIFQKTGNRAGEAVTLFDLSEISQRAGDIPTATKYRERRNVIIRWFKNPTGEGDLLCELGME